MKIMKFVPITILLAAFSTSRAVAASIVGGPIQNPANGHSYYLLSKSTWTDAEAYAVTLGGHLATINDAAENSWLYANVNFGDSTKNPWMGYNDANEDGIWTWASGEVSGYVNWAPGEPSNFFPHEDYGLFIGYTYPEKWNNAPNQDLLFGIAEVVPEPSVMSLFLVSTAVLVRKKIRFGLK